MRKEISIPQFIVEAIKDLQEAYNIYYHSSDIPSRHRIKKYKESEYSFSAVICNLIVEGIEKEFNMSQKTNKTSWLIPQNYDRFKDLIEAAFKKSQKFSIDNPHREEVLE